MMSHAGWFCTRPLTSTYNTKPRILQLPHNLGKSKFIAKADVINFHHIVMPRSQKPVSQIKPTFRTTALIVVNIHR